MKTEVEETLWLKGVSDSVEYASEDLRCLGLKRLNIMESMSSGPRERRAVGTALIGCRVLAELGWRDSSGVVSRMLRGVGTSHTNLVAVLWSRPMIVVLQMRHGLVSSLLADTSMASLPARAGKALWRSHTLVASLLAVASMASLPAKAGKALQKICTLVASLPEGAGMASRTPWGAMEWTLATRVVSVDMSEIMNREIKWEEDSAIVIKGH
jgi:hypothetical protein